VPTFKVRGIVIKKHNLQEADRLFTLFTDNLGKIKAHACGVRKSTSKLSGHLDLFTLCDLILAKGKSIPIIVAAEAEESFLDLKKNLEKTSAAFHAAELIDKFTFEGHRDTRIFQLIHDLFKMFDKRELKRPQIAVLLRSFELKLLNLLGFSPELVKCVRCGKLLAYETNYFNSIVGGMLCIQCKTYDPSNIKLDALVFKILRLFLRENFDVLVRIKFERREVLKVEKITNHFIQFLLEKKLRSPEFIKKVEQLA
jgi:DNA repair protein RecO (recombination protein O)